MDVRTLMCVERAVDHLCARGDIKRFIVLSREEIEAEGRLKELSIGWDKIQGTIRHKLGISQMDRRLQCVIMELVYDYMKTMREGNIISVSYTNLDSGTKNEKTYKEMNVSDLGIIKVYETDISVNGIFSRLGIYLDDKLCTIDKIYEFIAEHVFKLMKISDNFKFVSDRINAGEFNVTAQADSNITVISNYVIRCCKECIISLFKSYDEVTSCIRFSIVDASTLRVFCVGALEARLKGIFPDIEKAHKLVDDSGIFSSNSSETEVLVPYDANPVPGEESANPVETPGPRSRRGVHRPAVNITPYAVDGNDSDDDSDAPTVPATDPPRVLDGGNDALNQIRDIIKEHSSLWCQGNQTVSIVTKREDTARGDIIYNVHCSECNPVFYFRADDISRHNRNVECERVRDCSDTQFNVKNAKSLFVKSISEFYARRMKDILKAEGDIIKIHLTTLIPYLEQYFIHCIGDDYTFKLWFYGGDDNRFPEFTSMSIKFNAAQKQRMGSDLSWLE
jgi:hypothetical protein